MGLRERTYYVMSGSVMNVWTHVERVLTSGVGNHTPSMQVVRLKPKDGKRIVGVLIPQDGVKAVLSCLQNLQSNPHKVNVDSLGPSQSAQPVKSLSRASLPPISTGQVASLLQEPPRLSVGTGFMGSSAPSTPLHSMRSFGNTTYTPSSASPNLPSYNSRTSFNSLRTPQSATNGHSRLAAAFQRQPISQIHGASQYAFPATATSTPRGTFPGQNLQHPTLTNRVSAGAPSFRPGKINWVSQDNALYVGNRPVRGALQNRILTQPQVVRLQPLNHLRQPGLQVVQQQQQQQQQLQQQTLQTPGRPTSSFIPNNAALQPEPRTAPRVASRPIKYKVVWDKNCK